MTVYHSGTGEITEQSKAYIVAFERQKLGVVIFANSVTGLSIAREIVDLAVGGDQPALAWLKYESYKSPGRVLLKNILAKGADAALGEYRQWRQGRAPGEVVNENQMNRIGYDLLSAKAGQRRHRGLQTERRRLPTVGQRLRQSRRSL